MAVASYSLPHRPSNSLSELKTVFQPESQASIVFNYDFDNEFAEQLRVEFIKAVRGITDNLHDLLCLK